MKENGSTPAARCAIARCLNRCATAIRWVSLGLVAVSLILLALTLPLEAIYEAVKQWIERLGIWGPVALIGLYLVTALVMFPIWPLNVAAGALYGFFGGTAIALFATTVSAMFGFQLTRRFGRGWMVAKIRRHPRFGALDHAVAKKAWKVVALVRLSKVMPFHLQNYLFGLTKVRFWPYTLVSAIAMTPGTAVIVYLGQIGKAGLAARAGDEPAGAGYWATRIVGLVALAGAVFYLSRLARRAIAKADQEQEQKADSSESSREDQQPNDQQMANQQTTDRQQDGQPDIESGWPWASLAALAIALMLLCAAIWLYLNQGSVSSSVVDLSESSVHQFMVIPFLCHIGRNVRHGRFDF